MKRTVLIIALLCAMFTATAYVICIATPAPLFGIKVKGSGELITRTIDAPAFTGIKASRAVKVVITDRVSDKITIEADDNIMQYVVVEAREGILRATIDNELKSISRLNVTVTVPANGSIRSLDASSAAQITGEVQLSTLGEFLVDASSAAKVKADIKADACDLEASSAAKIEATVQGRECDVEASSAAKIEADLQLTKCNVELSSAAKATLKGAAEACEVEVSSASKLDAAEFTATNCNVDVSSAGSVSINCTGMLHAEATSGGSIDYTGDPTTRIKQSSGGRVRHN